jgi:hypothetical protein
MTTHLAMNALMNLPSWWSDKAPFGTYASA